MTVPFEPDDVVRLAAWLGQPTPEVQAVRVPCESEAEWLDARLGGIGASEIGVVMGVSSWASPYALWYRKRLDWRLPRTEAMRWGHLVEDPIAELFAEQHDELFLAVPVGSPYSLWCHPVRRWMLATPDRLAVDRDGRVCPVELKSDEGGPGWGKPGTDEVPEHHKLQVQWQAHIFGSHGGWVVRKRGSGRGRVTGYWIPYDPNLGADMVDAGGAFLESIERNEPPDPDGSKSTTETLREINPALDEEGLATVSWELYYEWIEAREAKRDAGKREALASNQLRAAMGRAEFAVTHTGERFAKRRIGKRAGYEVPPSQTDELREINSGDRATDRDLSAGAGSMQDGGRALPADPEAAPPSEQEGLAGGGGEAGPMADGEDPARPAVNPDPYPDCPHEWHGADGGACPLCGWDSHPIPEVDGEFKQRFAEFMKKNAEAMRRLAAGPEDDE